MFARFQIPPPSAIRSVTHVMSMLRVGRTPRSFSLTAATRLLRRLLILRHRHRLRRSPESCLPNPFAPAGFLPATPVRHSHPSFQTETVQTSPRDISMQLLVRLPLRTAQRAPPSSVSV